MEKVKRFTVFLPGASATLSPHDCGELVRYSDYDTLHHQLAEVAAAGENVVKMWSRMDDIQMNAAIVSFQAAVAKAQGERREGS